MYRLGEEALRQRMKNITTWLDNKPAVARTVFLVALSVVVVYSIVWIQRYASVTTDQNLYDDIDGSVTVVSVTSGGVSDRAGLMVGDIIVAVNGDTVSNKYEANEYLMQGRRGHVIRYTIERAGTRLDIDVVMAEFGLPLQYLGAIVTGYILIALAAFVYLRRTSYGTARLFGWAHLSFGFALLVHRGVGMPHYPDMLSAVSVVLHPTLWVIAVTLFMHLLLHFPVARYVRPVPPPMLTALYAIPGTAFFILLMFVHALPIAGVVGVLLPFIGLNLSIVAVQVLFRRRMKNLESADYPHKARPVHVTLFIALVYIAGLFFLTVPSDWQALFFSGIFIPFSILTSVIRLRIFDLYIVVRRRSMYALLSGSLVLLLILVFFFTLLVLPKRSLDLPVIHVGGGQIELLRSSALSAEQRDVFEKRWMIAAGVFLILALWFSYTRGHNYLDQRFYRGSYDYKRALTAFSNLSHSYSDKRMLAEAVVADVVTIMRLKGAAFSLREDGGFRMLASHRLPATKGMLLFSPSALAELEQEFKKARVRPVDNLEQRDRFMGYGIDFLVGVSVDRDLHALLLLGEKESETNYSREDVELLENLAINISDSLLTMRFYEEAKEQERLRSELEIARHIQLQSLPTELPEFPGIDIAARCIPATEVGGDFYDVLPRHDSTTLLLGDVSGKGTPAAMYVARIQGIFKTIESYQPSLWELFVRLNTQVFDHFEKRNFVTISALRVDFMSNEVRIIRAGHLPVLHFNTLSREVIEHQPGGMAIGLDRQLFAEKLEEQGIFVRGGDVFVMLSDGVTEVENSVGEQFGIEGVRQCIIRSARGNATEILESIFSEIQTYSDVTEMQDDATVMVVKFHIRDSH